MIKSSQERGCSGWFIDNLAVIILVLVIAAILAAIARPFITPPPYEGKCRRVASDFHNIATAIAAYAVDEGEYPVMPFAFDAATTKSLSRLRQGIPALSTPIAYLSTAWKLDPFPPPLTPSDPPYYNAPYHYYRPGKCWMLWSLGPDGEFTLTPKALNELHNKKRDVFLPRIHEFAYDPTNGTISAGDIIWLEDRTQSGIPGHKSYQRK